jgi:hypothetical protein
LPAQLLSLRISAEQGRGQAGSTQTAVPYARTSVMPSVISLAS